MTAALRLDPNPKPSGQFLRELPGDPSRARAARGRPFQRFVFKLFFGEFDAKMAAIAFHHGKVLVLTAAVKAEPQSEPVRERDFFLDRFTRIDRGGAFILDHLARQEM